MSTAPYQREYRRPRAGAAEIQAFLDAVLPQVQQRAREARSGILDLRDIHPALGVLDLAEPADAAVAAVLPELEVAVTEPRHGVEPVSVGIMVGLCLKAVGGVVAVKVAEKLVDVSLDAVLEHWIEPVIRRRFGFDTLKPPIGGPRVDLTDRVVADLREDATTELDLRDATTTATTGDAAVPAEAPGREAHDAPRPDQRSAE